MPSAANRVVIETFVGNRTALATLFALADDSPAAVASYCDSGILLVAREGGAVIGLALLIHHDAKQSELDSARASHELQVCVCVCGCVCVWVWVCVVET